jgi:hypothetical protein
VNYRVNTIDKGNNRDVGQINTWAYKTFCLTVDAVHVYNNTVSNKVMELPINQINKKTDVNLH